MHTHTGHLPCGRQGPVSVLNGPLCLEMGVLYTKNHEPPCDCCFAPQGVAMQGEE